MFKGREAARWESWKALGPERRDWHWQCVLVTCAQDSLPLQCNRHQGGNCPAGLYAAGGHLEICVKGLPKACSDGESPNPPQTILQNPVDASCCWQRLGCPHSHSTKQALHADTTILSARAQACSKGHVSRRLLCGRLLLVIECIVSHLCGQDAEHGAAASVQSPPFGVLPIVWGHLQH